MQVHAIAWVEQSSGLAARQAGLRSARLAEHRRGATLFLCIALIFALLAVASLAVDFGSVVLARQQLQAAADAAALAALEELESGSLAFHSAATDTARANPGVGALNAGGAIRVETGTWSFTSRSFAPCPHDAANAVRVTLQRTRSTGDPIQLQFARFIGVDAVDVAAAAVAAKTPRASQFNLVGIDSARFAAIGALAGIKGRIVSNGEIRIGWPLGLLVAVNGDARSWLGAVRVGALSSVSGSTARLDRELFYPPVTLPSSNNNDRISAYLDSDGDCNVVLGARFPAGTYVVRDLNLLAGIAMNLDGPVTFYVRRNFNLAAHVNLLGNPNFHPRNFKVRVLDGGRVFFLADLLTPLNMDLYAPDSDVNVLVSVNRYYGRLIARNLNVRLPALSCFEECTDLDDPLPRKAQIVN